MDSLELDLEATKSTEKIHKEEETSWKKTRQMLENDLEAAETLLDKTKIQLEAEQKSRCVLMCVHTCICMYICTYVCMYVVIHRSVVGLL